MAGIPAGIYARYAGEVRIAGNGKRITPFQKYTLFGKILFLSEKNNTENGLCRGC